MLAAKLETERHVTERRHQHVIIEMVDYIYEYQALRFALRYVARFVAVPIIQYPSTDKLYHCKLLTVQSFVIQEYG